MIGNLLLGLIKGIVTVLLAPLEVINISIDFLAGIPIVTSFLQIIAYILPWNNILPIIVLTIGIFGFRILISFFKTLWEVIPFL